MFLLKSGLRLNDGSGVKLSIKLAGLDALSLVGPTRFNCLTSVSPASSLAVEYSSCFISVMKLEF